MTYRTAMMRRVPLATLMLVAACSHKPDARPAPATPTPAGIAAVDIERVETLLDAGDTKAAQQVLKALLKRDPNDPRAAVLRDSIDGDPKQQLGTESYAYIVKPGDTMRSIAERLLGNRLKFYQLARYNGIDAPATLSAGQTLRIPGSPPRPAAAPRPEPQRPAPQSPPPTPKPKPKAPPAPTKPVANPAAAAQARSAGLAALNQGNVARAVALLRRAAALDPGNALIARDLQRAERIAATVRARR